MQGLLQRYGIYTQYFPSIQSIYFHLKKRPEPVQTYAFSRLCASFKSADNHKDYDYLLRKFVPTLDLKMETAQFIPERGGGESSLNSLRKIKIDGKWFLEKVYFNQASDFKRNNWFDQCVRQNILGLGLIAPQLEYFFQGKAFTIAYFKFFELSRSNRLKNTEELIEVASILYQASTKMDFSKVISPNDNYLKNYEEHFECENNISKAQQRFEEEGINFQALKDFVDSSKRILSHGDLHYKNVFENKIVIDWDNVGVYPLGFDLAFLYHRIDFKEITMGAMEQWLNDNCREFMAVEDWNAFKRNFYFFLAIFTASNFHSSKFESCLEYFKKNDFIKN